MKFLDWLRSLIGWPPSPGPRPTPPAPEPPSPLGSVASALLSLHNAERSKRGLPPLRLDDRLGTAAAIQASDCARTGLLSHVGSDGSTAGQRMRRCGYRWSYEGENEAEGYPTPEAVMARWMISAGHSYNALNPLFTGFGAAVAHTRSGVEMWIACYGRRITE